MLNVKQGLYRSFSTFNNIRNKSFSKLIDSTIFTYSKQKSINAFNDLNTFWLYTQPGVSTNYDQEDTKVKNIKKNKSNNGNDVTVQKSIDKTATMLKEANNVLSVVVELQKVLSNMVNNGQVNSLDKSTVKSANSLLKKASKAQKSISKIQPKRAIVLKPTTTSILDNPSENADEISALNRNKRKPKDANHGKRPVVYCFYFYLIMFSLIKHVVLRILADVNFK